MRKGKMVKDGSNNVPSLRPTSIWGQDRKFIYLTLNLTDAKYATVRIRPDSLFFKANGIGANGKHDYCLDFEFYKPLQPTGNTYKILGRTVEFKLLKDKVGEHWQQLCKDQPKPSWLKVDFDKFFVEDEEDEEETDNAKSEVDKVIPQLVDAEVQKLQQQVLGQIKVGYLVFYNLLQAVCFSIITGTILSRIIADPYDFHVGTYDITGSYMKFCQALAVLEVIHPLLGIVKSGVLTPAIQVFGRNMVLFMIISPQESIHGEKIVILLFLAWSLIEVIRYPQYALSVINYPIRIITWLRYTAWIPLYPVGFYLEGGMYMYKHMFKQRTKHLKNISGTSTSKKKS
ncbi:Very-long-chain (3R)-3-hydroxyacyl-CoA dehydratase [Trichoplax sp. H2]|nr:Very-long-chain (3R)-3-hydroxyacyl-CoA dehydratase [Trichoplax sp. H2]|eukprot:RDD46308.1 Very-long-chain (3R)-3-hydroxyacyl-CoA dehydratase [Trichoplax sp. H2]